MTRNHVCSIRCSHNVTDEQLAEWGYPVRKNEKICGMTILVKEGVRREKALHQAWLAGKVDFCHLPRKVDQTASERIQALCDRVLGSN